MKNICLALVAALTLTLSTAHAGDFDKGVAALNAGDYATALVEFNDLAEQGHAITQAILGLMYFNGDGVTQDYAEALKWFTLAAGQGHADAQNNLGLMHYNGEGVLQDYALAHMWANIAAANGNENGATGRDLAAEKMTQADIATAQRMARECMASNYANCGY